MKLTEEVKQKVQSLKRKFGNNCVIIYQKDADALFAIIDDWLSAVPETEALTDEQMRLMAHEVIDFNGGITDGVINMLQRHFSRRPAPAPEPAPQQDDYANYMRLAEELEQEQTSHSKTRKLLLEACKERDDAEQALSHAYYLITGKSPEWSNLFGHAEALEEIDTAQYLLRTEIASFKRLEREQETKPMPHDDLDKMRGEVDAAIPAEQERHEKEAYADTTGEISPQEKASQ